MKAGIPLCPPEGNAGTGMVATNSVAKRTGNVSAGTSVFVMVVLEKELSKVYSETWLFKGIPIAASFWLTAIFPVNTLPTSKKDVHCLYVHQIATLTWLISCVYIYLKHWARLKIGMDILHQLEEVNLDEILGHGDMFKTKGVGQSIMAAALNVPVSVMETQGEGGAWGLLCLHLIW